MLKPSLVRRLATSATSTRQAARELLKARSQNSPVPVIPTCPAPSCSCSDVPPDLDIDRSKDLVGTMAPYNEHLLIATGQADWKSRIENEGDNGTAWGLLTGRVKEALGPRGQFHDPYHNVVVSTSSFDNTSPGKVQAMLFPSFHLIEDVDPSPESIQELVKSFLLPEKLHPAHSQMSEEDKAAKTRSETPSAIWRGRVYPIASPTILICSHNNRDSRCGIFGPLLHQEFATYINKRHALRHVPPSEQSHSTTSANQRSFASHPAFRPHYVDTTHENMHPINIGMISHVGGHKWAGNVIVYIPPDHHCAVVEGKAEEARAQDRRVVSERTTHKDQHMSAGAYDQDLSPLAGKGIWYGRVEPKHVEGIVEQTIGHGTIIRELFRGGINADGTTLRL